MMKKLKDNFLYVIIGVFIGACLTSLIFYVHTRWQSTTHFQPGTVYASLPQEILSLTYTTNQLTLTAQRTKSGAVFSVQITYADERKPRHCIASPNLDEKLSLFSEIKARKQIQTQNINKDYPISLGTLAIKDSIAGEETAWQFFTMQDRTKVAVKHESIAFETETAEDSFEKLLSLCSNN